MGEKKGENRVRESERPYSGWKVWRGMDGKEKEVYKLSSVAENFTREPRRG